jgi:hypothetical protein
MVRLPSYPRQIMITAKCLEHSILINLLGYKCHTHLQYTSRPCVTSHTLPECPGGRETLVDTQLRVAFRRPNHRPAPPGWIAKPDSIGQQAITLL